MESMMMESMMKKIMSVISCMKMYQIRYDRISF